jgi:hypothetical protein
MRYSSWYRFGGWQPYTDQPFFFLKPNQVALVVAVSSVRRIVEDHQAFTLQVGSRRVHCWSVPGAALHPKALSDHVGIALQFLHYFRGCANKLLVFIASPEQSLARDYGEADRSKTYRNMLSGFEHEFQWLPAIQAFLADLGYSTTPKDGKPSAMEDQFH